MAKAVPADESNRPRFGRVALALGGASIALFIAGFFFLPWGNDLGLVVAIAALACGGAALRHRRGDTTPALIGAGLAFLVVLAVVLVVVTFAFTPGD